MNEHPDTESPRDATDPTDEGHKGGDTPGADDDEESSEDVSPVEGLLNPEEGVNSPAADADAQPPG